MHTREVRFDFRKWFCGFGCGTWVGGGVRISLRNQLVTQVKAPPYSTPLVVR
jgi:hypothetical protein